MSANLPDPPIVSPDWLVARLALPGLVIVDTRKGDGFATSHIPGAQKLGLNPLLHDPGRVVAPDVFAAEMERLGIGADTEVIAYDDGNNLFGARLWWVLHHYGHTRVRVLDGGWDGWVATGRPVTNACAPAVKPGCFTPRMVSDLLAETADVRAAMDDPNRQILDVRGDAEWQRAEPTASALAGHVPGALHLVWTDVIDPGTHRFRPALDLRTLMVRLGLRREAEIITYCQGGIRAAHAVLALNHAGFPRVRNYEGSWAEWSRQGMPCVVESPASSNTDKG